MAYHIMQIIFESFLIVEIRLLVMTSRSYLAKQPVTASR